MSDFDGARYRKAAVHQRVWGLQLIDALELQGDERVVDLGCGDGSLTAEIAARVPQGTVLGIDASASMMKAADELAGGNLSFRKLNLRRLDYDGEFDVVFSNSTLHWIGDHEDLLQRVHRALRPDGRIAFNFAGDGTCQFFSSAVREVMARPIFAPHFASFSWPWFMPSPEEYEPRLAAFRDVKVWGEEADYAFPDAPSMMRWIDQPCLVPFLAALPKPERDAFRDAVVAQMEIVTGRDDGTFFETFRRVRISARK